MTDPIVDAVCAKLQSRSAVGIGKYGVTLADSPEDTRAFLVHLQNELMDGANYVEKLLQPSPTDPERQAALDDLNEWLKSGAERTWDEVADILFTHRRTILAALQSPRAITDAERQAALDIVNEQAKDDGLWFVAKYASEAYLQQELRRLHRSIELAALQSPRVPVINGLDEEIDMVEKWYHGNQSALKTGPYIQFVRVIKYARAYAELQKGV